ncbi:hypothetical protein REPUB_Repub13aG0006100 [Reevesia pubescens]
MAVDPMANSLHVFAPSAGFVKVNVDATYWSSIGLAVHGVVTRDHGGKFLFSAVRKSTSVVSHLFVEMLSIKLGLDLALEYGFSRLIIESDSL